MEYPMTIEGLAELAASFPDQGWYEIRILIRRQDDGQAEVVFEKWLTKADSAPERSH